MAPHSSTWTEEPGRLRSMGSLRVGHDWATSLSFFTFHFHALEKEMATHSSVLAWRIPGMGESGGLPSMGLHRVRHDWSDLAAAVWNVAHQNPLPMEFSRQEYWSEFHFLLQGIFPTQGLKPHLLCLLHWQADSLTYRIKMLIVVLSNT